MGARRTSGADGEGHGDDVVRLVGLLQGLVPVDGEEAGAVRCPQRGVPVQHSASADGERGCASPVAEALVTVHDTVKDAPGLAEAGAVRVPGIRFAEGARPPSSRCSSHPPPAGWR